MCTRQFMHIKGVSVYTPRFLFIPCGECEECRNTLRSSWSVRLRCELDELVKRDWWLGFVTLTYSDKHLPHIPRVLLADECAHLVKKDPMCFSREHCKDFICDIRQYVKRNYDCVARKNDDGRVVQDDRPRYLLACEYGDSTKRCHYHLLLAFPPRVPQREIFDYIHKRWTLGHVFPRYFEGGVDSHGYEHKPFVVASVGAACAYCAKYVCKDLAYAETFKRAYYRDKVEIPDNPLCGAAVVRLRDFLPFHMQSRSLGLAFVRSLDDSRRLDMVLDGVSLIGSDKRVKLPKYMRDKILFNNYYVKDKEGKRLCRRFPTAFFDKFKARIFDSQVDSVAQLIDNFRNRHGRAIKVDDSSLIEYFSSLSSRDLAAASLSWFGVEPAHCRSVDPLDNWFAKYQCLDDGVELSEVDLLAPELDIEFTSKLNDFMTLVYLNKRMSLVKSDKLSRQIARTTSRVHDYFVHCE